MPDGSFRSLEQVAQEAASRSTDVIEQVRNHIKKGNRVMNQKEQDSVETLALWLIVGDLMDEIRRIGNEQ